MRLAIMQPYLFPYLGYFQLIRAVDRIVVYDDVNYIRQGWVNRNRILVNGQPMFFSVPIEGASSFTPIAHTRIHARQFARWRGKFLKTLQLNYRLAPALGAVLALVEQTLATDCEHIGDLARASVLNVLAFLAVRKEIVATSASYGNRHLEGCARVLDVCAREGAHTYINLPGGRALYTADSFAQRGIALRFIHPRLEAYPQNAATFYPALSMLDVLMFNGAEKTVRMLDDFTLE